MKKKSIALWALLLVEGCVAQEAPVSISEEAKTYAAKQYVRCISDAATRLDDGISSAQIVGAAVFRVCENEGYQLAATYAAELSPAARRAYFDLSPKTYLELAIEAVLLKRTSKSN